MSTFAPASISSTDQLVATLENNGRELLRLQIQNVSSIDQVVGVARQMAGKFAGLARLTVRNRTRGWTRTLTLATRRMPVPQPSAMGLATPA